MAGTPGRSGSFVGLEALISEEKSAAKGLSEVARAARDAASSVARVAEASGAAAEAAARAVAEAARPASGEKGSPAFAASVSGSDNSGVEGGISAVGDQLAVMGSRLKATLDASLAPLAGIGRTLVAQFDVVGGAALTTFRRIDAAIKFPGWYKEVKGIAGSLGEAAAATRSPAAKIALYFTSAAVNTKAEWEKVKNWFSSLGDVAGKSLGRLANLDLGKTAAGANGIASGLARVSPAAAGAVTSIKGVGREIAVALGAFGLIYKVTTAVADFFTRGVKGASDLAEATSAAGVTFGKSLGLVDAQASAMAKAYGLSKKAQLEAASGFGEMARGAGEGEKAAAEFANKFTALAADLNSRNNLAGGFQEASRLIQSALAGQSEPLRKFGVMIDEDSVKAYALAHGLASSSKEISNQAKMAARAALIQQGLASATGDLARTSGGAANQFRKAGGGLDNFAISIGEVLLPAITSGTMAFNDLLASVVEVFEANKPTIEAWANTAKSAIDFVGVGIRNAGDVWQIFKIKATEAASNALSWVEVLAPNLGLFAEWMGSNWLKLIGDAWNGVVAIFHNAGTYIGEYVYALWDMLSHPGSEFKPPNWEGFFAGFKAEAASLPDFIKPPLMDASKQVEEVLARIRAKDAKREKFVGQAAERGKAPGEEAKEAKDKGPKFAALAEVGSKEAYSAIIKYQAGGRDGSTQKAIVKNGRDQIAAVNKTTEAVNKLAGRGAVPTFAIV